MKRAALWACHRAGVFGAVRHLRQHSLLIVTYHGVMPGDDDRYHYLLDNFVSAAAFERQMRWLKRRYALVPLRAVADSLAAGGRPLPKGAATVTFDDGFANNFQVAFPILKRLAVPATIFLTTGKIGVPGAQLWTEQVKRAIYFTSRPALRLERPAAIELTLDGVAGRERAARAVLATMKRLPVLERDGMVADIEQACGRPELTPGDATRYDFLTWGQVHEMAASGVEFGSHTVSHPVLSSLSHDALECELRDSKARIEAELRTECYAFAYPNGKRGDFGSREQAMLASLGYRCALALEGGLNAGTLPPFALDRVNIAREFDDALLNARLSGVLGDLRRARSAVGALRSRPA